MKPILYILTIFYILWQISAEESDIEVSRSRKGKLLNLFNVVQFKNGPCSGATKNGTCYTATECSQKGGTNDGTTCAGGFGICCVFSLSCGATSSQNCTYFTMAATTSPTTNPCTMTFCKCSSNICRIRLDFVNHVIANPIASGTLNAGQCVTDTFSVTSPGNKSPPVICGYNTGQHMFVDASDACHEMNFNFGTTDTTSSRSFDIKVTQYECGNEKGGPKGCLQYYTGTSGKIANYNYRTDGTSIAGATHLYDQMYTNCFRREAGYCRICFSLAQTRSFGTDTEAMSKIDSSCTKDYVLIPGAFSSTAASSAPTAFKLCGQRFNSATTSASADDTTCTQTLPFQLSFVSNNEEAANEANGSIGYYLNYKQEKTCT